MGELLQNTAWEVPLTPTSPDVPVMVDAALARAIEEARELAIWSRADAVVEQIAAAAGVTSTILRGPCRRRELVELRRIAARCLREQGPLSLSAIGRALGRDHTTAMNLLRSKAAR